MLAKQIHESLSSLKFSEFLCCTNYNTTRQNYIGIKETSRPGDYYTGIEWGHASKLLTTYDIFKALVFQVLYFPGIPILSKEKRTGPQFSCGMCGKPLVQFAQLWNMKSILLLFSSFLLFSFYFFSFVKKRDFKKNMKIRRRWKEPLFFFGLSLELEKWSIPYVRVRIIDHPPSGRLFLFSIFGVWFILRGWSVQEGGLYS